MTLFPHNHMKKWVLHTLGLFKEDSVVNFGNFIDRKYRLSFQKIEKLKFFMVKTL